MKYLVSLIIACTLAFTYSCKESTNTDTSESQNDVEQSTDPIDSDKINTDEESMADSLNEEKSEDQDMNATNESEVANAKDNIHGAKGVNVNKNTNPDNMNMSFDVAEEKSHIEFVPLLFNSEKDFYFVQILVSASKLPRSYFEKMFSSTQRVYVAKIGQNYKYAIGKFASKAEADKKLVEYKKQFDLKEAKVTKFTK